MVIRLLLTLIFVFIVIEVGYSQRSVVYDEEEVLTYALSRQIIDSIVRSDSSTLVMIRDIRVKNFMKLEAKYVNHCGPPFDSIQQAKSDAQFNRVVGDINSIEWNLKHQQNLLDSLIRDAFFLLKSEQFHTNLSLFKTTDTLSNISLPAIDYTNNLLEDSIQIKLEEQAIALYNDWLLSNLGPDLASWVFAKRLKNGIKRRLAFPFSKKE